MSIPGEGSNAAPASMVPGPGDSTLRKNFFQLQENNRTLTDEEPSKVNKQENNKQERSGVYLEDLSGHEGHRYIPFFGSYNPLYFVYDPSYMSDSVV